MIVVPPWQDEEVLQAVLGALKEKGISADTVWERDLLGIPVRITISPRTLEKNSVELKWRSKKESELVPLEGVAARLKGLIAEGLATLPNSV